MKVMSASLLFCNESHFRLGIVLIFSGNVVKSFLDKSKCAKLSIFDRSHGIFVIPVSAKDTLFKEFILGSSQGNSVIGFTASTRSSNPFISKICSGILVKLLSVKIAL